MPNVDSLLQCALIRAIPPPIPPLGPNLSVLLPHRPISLSSRVPLIGPCVVALQNLLPLRRLPPIWTALLTVFFFLVIPGPSNWATLLPTSPLERLRGRSEETVGHHLVPSSQPTSLFSPYAIWFPCRRLTIEDLNCPLQTILLTIIPPFGRYLQTSLTHTFLYPLSILNLSPPIAPSEAASRLGILRGSVCQCARALRMGGKGAPGACNRAQGPRIGRASRPPAVAWNPT